MLCFQNMSFQLPFKSVSFTCMIFPSQLDIFSSSPNMFGISTFLPQFVLNPTSSIGYCHPTMSSQLTVSQGENNDNEEKYDDNDELPPSSSHHRQQKRPRRQTQRPHCRASSHK